MQIRLSAELGERIRAYAESQQITRSDAIRQLIEVGLAALDEAT